MITVKPQLMMRADGNKGQMNLLDVQCSERSIVKSYIILRKHKNKQDALEQTFGNYSRHAFTHDAQNTCAHHSNNTWANDSKHIFSNNFKRMLRWTLEQNNTDTQNMTPIPTKLNS